MAAFTGRDKYEDYTYDDGINDIEEYDEYDEGEISLTGSISDWFKRTKSSIFRKSDEEMYDDGDEDYEDDEDLYEDDDDVVDYAAKERTRRIYARKRAYEEADLEEEVAPKKKAPVRSGGYTREDYDSYDKKYGTRGSYVRAEQSEKNRAKVLGSKKEKKRPVAENVTKLYREERYKGNVKGVVKFSPKDVNDTNDIADSLMNEYAALIDLRGIPKTEILRILDFVDGVAYVLGYNFDELSKEMYMCAPKGFLKNYTKSRYQNVSND